MVDCPLCKVVANEPFLYEDKHVKIASTMTLKGHQYRIMVMTKEHVAHVSRWLEEYMMDRLEATGRQVFATEPKFIIMSPIFGTVTHHAHFVATDLNPDSDDFRQVLETPWLRVIDV